MVKVKKSEYIVISRIICRTLFKTGCFGKGSMYFDNLCKSLSDRDFSNNNLSNIKIEKVIEALIKQKIISQKKKKHGWKYYLNMERYDKIKEIIKETGKDSIIPMLLLLV